MPLKRTKAKKRKIPVTDNPRMSSTSSNPYSSRSLIRQFHVLLKRRSQLQNRRHDPQSAQALIEVEERIDALGGLGAYQRMSSIGQGNDRGGGSHRIFLSWLKEMGTFDDRIGKCKLRLLEVGALKPDNYASCSAWIDCTPIDLRSPHPSILEQDFLLMDEIEHRGKWDLISLSLVLNFVPEPKDRGRMLLLTHHMLVESGLLFVALPMPCVRNSRYLTPEHLKAMFAEVGFVEVKEKCERGGRMVYWILRKVVIPHDGRGIERFQRKVVLKKGNRNNFCIFL